MGSPKALLPDREGVPFVVRIARAFHAAGVGRIVIVTGSQHDRIAQVIEAASAAVELIRNPQPRRGQLSSLWTGLSVSADAEGVLVTLVDVPLIAVSTIRAVTQRWTETRAPIVRPIHGGRRGHPVLFDRAVFDELRAAPLDEGARAVVRAHWDESIDVPVDDPGCLIDVDTPEEYRALSSPSAAPRAR